MQELIFVNAIIESKEMQLKKQSARCCAPEGSFTQNYVTASGISGARTLGPAYNEFSHNKHPAKTSQY